MAIATEATAPTKLVFRQEAQISVGTKFVRVGRNIFPKGAFVLPLKEPSVLELSARWHTVPGLRVSRKRPGLHIAIASSDNPGRHYLLPELLLLPVRRRR